MAIQNDILVQTKATVDSLNLLLAGAPLASFIKKWPTREEGVEPAAGLYIYVDQRGKTTEPWATGDAGVQINHVKYPVNVAVVAANNGDISEILAKGLVPVLQLFGALLDVAADVIDALVPFLDGFVDVVKIVSAELMTLVDLFKSLGILTFFKGVIEQLVHEMKEVIKIFILLGATIAKFLGFNEVVAGFIRNLQKQDKPEEKALNKSIDSVAFKGVDDISKSIQQAAFAAIGWQ